MLIANLVIEHLDEVALQGFGGGSRQVNRRVVHNFKMTLVKPNLCVLVKWWVVGNSCWKRP